MFLQAKWRKKLSEAQTAAKERQASAEAALQAEKRTSHSQAELSKAAMADLEQELEEMQQQHARLSGTHSSVCSENAKLKVILLFAHIQLLIASLIYLAFVQNVEES